MEKQAIALYWLDLRNRYDKVNFWLNYPQRPIVGTMTDKSIPILEAFPTGKFYYKNIKNILLLF